MSVDNIMDFDATSVSITPKCGLHDEVLEVSGRPTLTSEPHTDEGGEIVGWFVDLGEFACPTIEQEMRYRDYRAMSQSVLDDLYERDGASWYMAVTMEVKFT